MSQSQPKRCIFNDSVPGNRSSVTFFLRRVSGPKGAEMSHVWAGRLWPDPEVSPPSHQLRSILSAGFTPDMTLCQKSSVRSGGEKCWTEALSSLLSPIFGAFLPALNKTHTYILSCQQSLWCFSFCCRINTVVRFEPTERIGYRARAIQSLVPRNRSNHTAGGSHRQGCAPSFQDIQHHLAHPLCAGGNGKTMAKATLPTAASRLTGCF